MRYLRQKASYSNASSTSFAAYPTSFSLCLSVAQKSKLIHVPRWRQRSVWLHAAAKRTDEDARKVAREHGMKLAVRGSLDAPVQNRLARPWHTPILGQRLGVESVDDHQPEPQPSARNRSWTRDGERFLSLSLSFLFGYIYRHHAAASVYCLPRRVQHELAEDGEAAEVEKDGEATEGEAVHHENLHHHAHLPP